MTGTRNLCNRNTDYGFQLEVLVYFPLSDHSTSDMGGGNIIGKALHT